MHLFAAFAPRQDVNLRGRDEQDEDKSGGVAFGIVVGIIVVIVLLFALYVVRRSRRKQSDPTRVPTPFLKNLWKKWESGQKHERLPTTSDHLEPVSSRRVTALSQVTPARSSTIPDTTAPAASQANRLSAVSTTSGAGVDRNTSVRSVMTLPPYHPDARQNEQVLGREGERGGIDVVIEFPETNDQEEARREEEMDALYQVRLARRRENEEREERRRLRREARERGDYVALREIQSRARAESNASGERTVEELRREHERIKNERQRAVSSVSYADLGVARHDGTRLRANSNESLRPSTGGRHRADSGESEREGLLNDAASIAASSRYHRRDVSGGSILSIDTVNSDLPSPGLPRPRANSRSESPLPQSSNEQNDSAGTGAGSSPEIIEYDDIPPNSPPGYENISLDTPQDTTIQEPPPDYSSPTLDRGEVRPTFEPIERRPSHVGNLLSEPRRNSRSSVSDSTTRPTLGEQRSSSTSSRGLGGVPQLPSLRLASLPSIQVDPGSPVVGNDRNTHAS
ncbi:hypothetical protein B7494_g554 [Chlorociboria aeruginascens]|nr:hypothetical protein B7494_g554 [Chlorociboria aeruginascens]